MKLVFTSSDSGDGAIYEEVDSYIRLNVTDRDSQKNFSVEDLVYNHNDLEINNFIQESMGVENLPKNGLSKIGAKTGSSPISVGEKLASASPQAA